MIFLLFDEASMSVRHDEVGDRLPMSPFCVRRRVAFDTQRNEQQTDPTDGAPQLFAFIALVKHIEGNESEGTPYAWHVAEPPPKSVDDVLTLDDFTAQCFCFGDRALPEVGEMHAQKLVRRREGQRQVLLAARDYESRARLMLPVYEPNIPNLFIPITSLKEFLREGPQLIGAVLRVKAQEVRIASPKVTGFMGKLLVARYYLRKLSNAPHIGCTRQLQLVNLNGPDDLARKMLNYFKTHAASPAAPLCRGLRTSNRGAFVELAECLTRFELIVTAHQGCSFSSEGRRCF